MNGAGDLVASALVGMLWSHVTAGWAFGSAGALMLAGAALVAAGVAAWGIAYAYGFRLWGINNSVTWGQLITVDFFFIGLSAGSLVVSSLVYVFGQEKYKPIGRMAVYMGLLLMMGAMFTVLTDLGRPEKFWRLFMYFYLSNMKSMFGINGIFYAGYILLLGTYLVAALSGSKLTKFIAPVAVLWLLCTFLRIGPYDWWRQSRYLVSIAPVLASSS